jgi:tyrosyl-DNA phosphodiesterase 2
MQMSKLPVGSFKRRPVRGRELWTADVSIGGVTTVVATSHLESPKGDMYSQDDRDFQARKCLRLLRRSPNVIFGGDMNWDEEEDGPFPLPDGWVDAWTELRPGEDGWTYDTQANPMLSGNPKLQRRLDRFVCRLPDFDMDSIEMIGKEAGCLWCLVREEEESRRGG